ncbi:MAG: DNA sulfur modification protein DndE [Cyanobacteria bacterium]|nr:DNA sulfur modification protein DndE [Cyanobacteria bacterium CG_2015-16_32_12]NCO78311.1 DNA sulfur modification protein DndE [Cyanobacteria bacterium CG_2015-22_32_23]NCQ03773.1 DNA sulfur modification protein DndE [Cyanobacteria bacterium CG_2015-09_32_10]NCQ42796.1 DNA sulfur modification protein DndE [Cyanobacteria bacterium CG_2015-04_32_10]NCS84529.1 DNA sulfur modification protein DndE [Cyanobacteria bacterium CG_2015-02_32_10]
MSSPIERIKLSKKAKDQLMKLKRVTKIDQWNILCRWAFCLSLAEKSNPAPYPIPADSNVEMSWHTFGGDMGDILLLALKYRCYQDRLGTDEETLNQQFRLHLHRGISYLAVNSDLQKLQNLLEMSKSAN